MIGPMSDEWISYAQAPGGHYKRDWHRILERQRHCCAYCGKPAGEERRLYRVRLVPARRGGTNNVGNLIGLCGTCKRDKVGLTWMEMRIKGIRSRRNCERVMAEVGWLGGNGLPARRTKRFLKLAVERGHLDPSVLEMIGR